MTNRPVRLPNIRPGGLIVADDTLTMRDEMPDYVQFVFNTPSLQSIDISLDDGIILSYKTGNAGTSHGEIFEKPDALV